MNRDLIQTLRQNHTMVLLASVLAMTATSYGQTDGCTAARDACLARVNQAVTSCSASQPIGGCQLKGSRQQSACTGAYNACSVMYAYPHFKVLSVLYLPPGNQSSVAYSTSASDGTTTSASNSFSTSNVTGFSFNLGGLSLGTSFTLANSSTNSSSAQQTHQATQAVTFKTASDPIDHTLDQISIWLNPQITVTNYSAQDLFTGQSTPFYQSFGTQFANAQYSPTSAASMDDAPTDAMSAVTVSVSQLQNPTTLPAGALVSQTLDGAIVPGLLKLCPGRIAESQCTQARAAQDACGCTAADFAPIVQADPFFSPSVLTVSSSPTLLDVNSVDPDNARFVAVKGVGGNSLLLTLAGPNSGVSSSTTTTISDTNNISTTYSHTMTEQVGASFGYKATTPSTSQSPASFNWTDSANASWSETKSVGSTTTNAHQQTVTMGTSTSACFTNVGVYEDTVYHTFAFINTSNAPNPCP